MNEVMLRSQSQAAYSPDNIGHFGLALPRYAHFTSPIRRYADLLVHRALIRGASATAHWTTAHGPKTHWTKLARNASPTPPSTSPRPSVAPSWPSATRSTVTWLHSWRTRWARSFAARISGVTRFGLFVTVAGKWRERDRAVSLAAGRLSGSMMKREQTLTGRRTRLTFSPGAASRGAACRGQSGHRRPGVPHSAGHA